MKNGYCEDCGCKVFNGHCVNCHEETYIAQQYEELNEELPKNISDKRLEQSIKLSKIYMKINDKVKVINGNNEIGQPTMIGKVGRISGFGTNYKVGGVDTKEVFVDFEHFGQQVFNDYHLEVIL